VKSTISRILHPVAIISLLSNWQRVYNGGVHIRISVVGITKSYNCNKPIKLSIDSDVGVIQRQYNYRQWLSLTYFLKKKTRIFCFSFLSINKIIWKNSRVFYPEKYGSVFSFVWNFYWTLHLHYALVEKITT